MRLEWDETGSKKYETGLDRGVLYPLSTAGKYDTGFSWEGLTNVNENPSGSEPQKFYADNITYANILSNEEYGATIESYTYPDEFEECDGSAELATGIYIGQQPRKKFGFSYRTKIGNDVNPELGYKIRLVYNCLASPSDRTHQTINDAPDLDQMSWEVSTDPVKVTGHKPTSTLVIDSTKVSAANLKALEDALYGIDAEAFDPTKTYTVGDYATHNSKTYKYIGAASFDPSYWTEVVATEFSTEATYAVGDYVTYDSDLYVCNTAIETAGTWDAEKWDAVTATAFNAETSYAVGDYVTYESKTYKCTTAIVIEGGWNPNEWSEVLNPDAHLPLPDEVASIITAG